MKVRSLSALAVVLVSTTAFGAPVVTITTPTSGAVVGDPATATGTLTSTYDIASLSVTVGSATATSTTAVPPSYGIALSLASVPYGPATLTVTARDVVGGVGTASVPIIVDREPTLSVTSPLDDAEANPNIAISATCSDDDPAGCTSLKAEVEGTVVAAASASVSGTYSLAAWQGRSVVLTITATDSRGRTVTSKRTVAVTGGTPRIFPGATEVATVPGRVVDYDGSRVLFATPTNTGATIRTLSSMSDTRLYSAGNAMKMGTLVAGRAALERLDGAFEWNGSVLTKFGARYAAGASKILFVTGPSSVATALVIVRDPLSSTTVYSRSDPAVWDVLEIAGAPNDDFVWTDVGGSQSLMRWRSGSLTTVVTTTYGIPFIATDGINIARVRSGTSSNDTALLSPTGTVLATLCTASVGGAPCDNARVANGWALYHVRTTSPAVRQVWRRSPTGATEKISVFSTDCSMEAISESGDVLYQNGGRRYLALDGASVPREVPAVGSPIRVGGAWYLLIDNSVYRIDGTSSGDAGVLDASAPDTATIVDGATPESGPADTSVTDTGSDVSAPDTAGSDASALDSSAADSTIMDATAADTAVAPDSNPPLVGDADAADDASGLPDDSGFDAPPPELGGCSVANGTSQPLVGVLGAALVVMLQRRRLRRRQR